jgi:ketopantoate hydroxymethyltransferase
MTGDGKAVEKKREKRTITEIHESEKTGEKMVYQSYNTVDRALANSKQLTIPTIGIGARVGTDGQMLLCHDLLGVFTDFKPKFTKRFAKQTEVAVARIKQYVKASSPTMITAIRSTRPSTRSLPRWWPSAARSEHLERLGT